MKSVSRLLLTFNMMWQEEGAPNSSRRKQRDLLYQAPVFLLDERRLHALLAEASRVDNMLQSNVSGVEVLPHSPCLQLLKCTAYARSVLLLVRGEKSVLLEWTLGLIALRREALSAAMLAMDTLLWLCIQTRPSPPLLRCVAEELVAMH